jgi:rubrerythrin
MMDFQQSKTYNNLLIAYNSELMASTKYELFADKARQEFYNEIADIFDITSRNEKAHARTWLLRLNDGVLPTTEQNLLDASEGEALTGSEIYREFARVAREEGYNEIAALFNGVANIELNHNLRFRTLYGNVVRSEVFCKPVEALWICMECGNIMSGICAPEICPVCGFPQGFYRLYDNETV